MKNTNTNIAKANGTTFIQFNGSNFAQPAYAEMRDGKVIATYQTNNLGEMTPAKELVARVKKAVSQGRISRTVTCERTQIKASSLKNVCEQLEGVTIEGSILDHATIL